MPLAVPKAIGVSNFQKHHIDELLTHSDVVPAVDQIESSPQFTNQELIGRAVAPRALHTEAWSPLGGTGGNLLSNPSSWPRSVPSTASHAAQVVIRWHIQRGIVVLPKSTHADRIRQNIDVFDFVLSDDDMAAISAMEHPASATAPTRTISISDGSLSGAGVSLSLRAIRHTQQTMI